MQIPLIGRQTQGIYPVNLFYQPETRDQRAALIGTPGLRLFCNLNYAHPVRQMHELNGYLYVVCGDTVYKVSPSGIKTTLAATLKTSTGYVWMADNGTQIMIVDGAHGYLIESDIVAEISDPDFPVPAALTYLDTYFIVIEKNTGRFYISANNDGSAWDALDFATAEGAPDEATAIIADHRELWIFGKLSTEIFYNSGDVDFPFERIQGAYLERGIGAAGSAAKLDNSVFWLSETYQVVRALEYQPIIISTRQIENEIAGYAVKSDATAYTYTQQGHSFYVLNFPAAGKTWVFDAATEMWHQRSSQPLDGRHRSNCYAFFSDKHLVGDYANGRIYQYDFETYDDAGAIQKAVHVFPPIEMERKTIFHHSIEIECSTGVGLVSGQGSDPVAILDWTDDKYKTWSNEHWLKMGQTGEYTARVIERRLGAARWRAYRLTITDPVERLIVSPYLEASKGGT